MNLAPVERDAFARQFADTTVLFDDCRHNFAKASDARLGFGKFRGIDVKRGVSPQGFEGGERIGRICFFGFHRAHMIAQKLARFQ